MAIKIRDVEGDAQELHDFFRNNGLKLNDYLNITPEKKLVNSLWLLSLLIIFIITNFLIWEHISTGAWYKLTVILCFVSAAIFVGIIQYNYEKLYLTGIATLGSIIIMLISLEVYSPQEIAQEAKEEAITKLKK